MNRSVQSISTPADEHVDYDCNYVGMIGATRFKEWSRDPHHTHYGLDCNPKANT